MTCFYYHRYWIDWFSASNRSRKKMRGKYTWNGGKNAIMTLQERIFCLLFYLKKKKLCSCVLRVTKCSLFFQFENCSNVWFKCSLLLRLKKRNYLVKITFSHFQVQHWWHQSRAKIIMHKSMCPLPLNNSIEPWIK